MLGQTLPIYVFANIYIIILDPYRYSTTKRLLFGENQAEVIKKVIREYDLQGNIRYFVTDNATNNDTAIDIALADLMPYLTPKQRLGRRLRCLGHVINLAVKAYLFGKDVEEIETNAVSYRENLEVFKELELWRKRGPVGKLHNIIIFICRTP
jgi:hypothetical protein